MAKQLTFLQPQGLHRGEASLERELELEGSNWRRLERKEMHGVSPMHAQWPRAHPRITPILTTNIRGTPGPRMGRQCGRPWEAMPLRPLLHFFLAPFPGSLGHVTVFQPVECGWKWCHPTWPTKGSPVILHSLSCGPPGCHSLGLP